LSIKEKGKGDWHTHHMPKQIPDMKNRKRTSKKKEKETGTHTICQSRFQTCRIGIVHQSKKKKGRLALTPYAKSNSRHGQHELSSKGKSSFVQTYLQEIVLKDSGRNNIKHY